MISSLSNLANNLSEEIDRIKCKYGDHDKICEIYTIKYKYCNFFLKNTNFKDNLIEYKCSIFCKNFQRKLDEKLKERFFNTYKFFSQDNDKFIFLLRKGVYPYEYTDD